MGIVGSGNRGGFSRREDFRTHSLSWTALLVSGGEGAVHAQAALSPLPAARKKGEQQERDEAQRGLLQPATEARARPRTRPRHSLTIFSFPIEQATAA